MYGSVEGSIEYHTLRGNSEWLDLETGEKSALLVKGTTILDALYAHRFPGRKTGGFNQIDQWPRTGARSKSGEVIPVDVVPVAVEMANYELSNLLLVNDGLLDMEVIDPNRMLKKEKIDVIETEYYKNMSATTDLLGLLPLLPIVEGILSEVLEFMGDFPVYWVR